jgi:beta-glucanase (GH16 family)
VREAQPNVRLYTPRFGRIEMRARFTGDPRTMGALWMIGYEDVPEHSAEICVCEIFGRDVQPHEVAVGVGVHPFGDPTLEDEFSREPIAIDATAFHEYAADWTPEGVTFRIDGATVKEVAQSPAYPMQLMLGLYEFPEGDADRSDGYPKELVVDVVRGYRLVV